MTLPSTKTRGAASLFGVGFGVGLAVFATLLAACGGAIAPDPGDSRTGDPKSGGGQGGEDGSSSGSSPGNPGAPADPDQACPDIDCLDGATILLDAPNGWKKGNYRFLITTEDNRFVDCSGKIPLPRCSSGAGITCSGVLGSSGENATILTSGCGLPPEEQGFSTIRIPNVGQMKPATMAFRVFIQLDDAILGTDDDGNPTTVADESFVVEYRTFRPNGPECGPTCNQGSHTMRIP